MRFRPAVAALALALLGAACAGGTEERGGSDPRSCGLPTPDPSPPARLIPPELDVDGAELVTARKERGGFLATFNFDGTVQDGIAGFRAAVEEMGFDVVSEDDEVFEAELYLQQGGKVGAVQIRRSTCDDRSIAFVNVVALRKLGGGVSFPVPKGAKSPSARPSG